MTVIDSGLVPKIDNLTASVVAKVTDVMMLSGVEMSPIQSPAKKITITTTITWRTTDHTIIHIFTMIMVLLVKMEPICLLMMVKLSSEISSDLTSNQVRFHSSFPNGRTEHF